MAPGAVCQTEAAPLRARQAQGGGGASDRVGKEHTERASGVSITAAAPAEGGLKSGIRVGLCYIVWLSGTL